MKSAASPKWQLLKSGIAISIKPGDACCLLPNKCWFKIILVPDTMEESDHGSKRKADEDSIEPPDKKLCSTSSTEAVISPSETLNEILNDHNDNVKVENEDVSNKEEETVVIKDIYSASSPEEHKSQAENFAVASTSGETFDVYQASTSRKESDENVKDKEMFTGEHSGKIKEDESDHVNDQSEDSNDVVMTEERRPAPNQNQTGTSFPRNINNPKRDKCAYGKACYRKNPHHKAQFSHPGDSDYETLDERPECPYGVRCYRKTAQHKAKYKHISLKKTPRRQASKPVRPARREFWSDSDQSTAEESVDESEYDPLTDESSEDTKSDWDSKSEHEDGTTG